MIDKIVEEGGFVPTVKDAMGELQLATKDYTDELAKIESTAKTSFDETKDGIDKTIEETKKLLGDNEKLIQQYEDKTNKLKDMCT